VEENGRQRSRCVVSQGRARPGRRRPNGVVSAGSAREGGWEVRGRRARGGGTVGIRSLRVRLGRSLIGQRPCTASRSARERLKLETRRAARRLWTRLHGHKRRNSPMRTGRAQAGRSWAALTSRSKRGF